MELMQTVIDYKENNWKYTKERFKMKKYIVVMIVACITLVGCAKTEDAKNLDDQEEFSINEKDLENDGYSEIARIAYGKIESSSDRPIVHLVYRKTDPEVALYLMSAIMRRFNLECDFIIMWNGEKYVIDKITGEFSTKENLSEIFPNDWNEAVQSILSDMDSGGGIDGFVSKKDADRIDLAVDNFVSQFVT